MTVYVSAYMPRQKPDSVRLHERRGLLAKIHVAKAQMGLTDDEYGMILKSFKVESSADMTIRQLENMIKLLKHYGWKQLRRHGKKEDESPDQHVALRDRAVEIAADIPNGQARLAGLVSKICGVDKLDWCRSTAKLERLLKVLGNIRDDI